MIRKTLCLFFFQLVLCAFNVSNSQADNDSLWIIYNNKTAPLTKRLQAIDDISWNYLSINPDSAFVFGKLELQLAKTVHQKSESLAWQIKAFNNMGISFLNKSDYPKALVYQLKSLKLNEEIKNKRGIAISYIYIGNIYFANLDFQKSLKYYIRSLRIFEKLKDNRDIAGSYGNIASVYSAINNHPKALDYQFRSLKIFKEINDMYGLAFSYSNIGLIYFKLSNYPEALNFQLKSLAINEKMGDKKGISYSLGNIGLIYYQRGEFKPALDYSLKAIQICQEIGDLSNETTFQKTVYDIFKNEENTVKALKHFERLVLLRDSIYKEENQKLLISNEMSYEFDKKQAISKAFQDKKDLLAEEKEYQQKVILFSVVIGLIFVVFLTVFLFNRFRISQKQKSIIEHQKQLIEVHQMEIIDSITYAKRIQDAILPPIDLIKEKLPNTFVLYKPKDIVAGDFYWMEEINDTILLAAADCTGHGVPGAMVSVVCSNALNRAVNEFHIIDTGEILDKVSNLVIETFEKSAADVKDGMDISLLSINKRTKQIQWSGANNPLWFTDNDEMSEIKADKQPIGKSDQRKSFITHSIEYVQNRTFYLFTDGYADQFGGPNGKKFKYKQFKEILLEIANNESNTQQIKLDATFEKWKGELEQVDDVCIISIKID